MPIRYTTLEGVIYMLIETCHWLTAGEEVNLAAPIGDPCIMPAYADSLLGIVKRCCSFWFQLTLEHQNWDTFLI